MYIFKYVYTTENKQRVQVYIEIAGLYPGYEVHSMRNSNQEFSGRGIVEDGIG
jgi:hypothetical protein